MDQKDPFRLGKVEDRVPPATIESIHHSFPITAKRDKARVLPREAAVVVSSDEDVVADADGWNWSTR